MCYVLKIAPHRGEGEKREEVQISKQSSQNLGQLLIPPLYVAEAGGQSESCTLLIMAPRSLATTGSDVNSQTDIFFTYL